ncbi:MAG: type II toxin-antitoxin system VapB family antitoxin [bacterium]
MRTMVEIEDKVLNEVVNLTGAKNKKNAILIAIDDYLRMKKGEALAPHKEAMLKRLLGRNPVKVAPLKVKELIEEGRR